MDRKKPPITEYEKHLLIQLVQPNLSMLVSRRTDGVTLKKKQEAWEKLTVEFNSSPKISLPVTCKQLKKMWQNLKTKARDAKTLANQANKTGGGPQPPEIGALESQVLAVIPNDMPTIEYVDIDCDITYLKEHKIKADDDNAAWLSKKNRVSELESLTQPSISSQDDTLSEHSEPSTTRTQSPQASITLKKKRKERNQEEETIDGIKKKKYLRELQRMEEKFEFERNLLLEKHIMEMEILDIKKQIALKELNK